MALTLSEIEHGTNTVRDQNTALSGTVRSEHDTVRDQNVALSEIRTWHCQRSEHGTNTVRVSEKNIAVTLSVRK